ncbi:MAG: hypothetical protein WCG81_09300 [Candidatus Angelobacter sp.]
MALSFLPTFAAELVPGLDLFPTWTAAVFFATRQLNSAPEQDAVDRDPNVRPSGDSRASTGDGAEKG